MSLNAFLQTLDSHVRVAPWIHWLRPAPPAEALGALPDSLRPLYAAFDGAELDRVRFNGDIVCVGLELFALADVCPIAMAMHGTREPGPWPNPWLAIGRATDGVWYLAHDPATGRYYTVSPIVHDETVTIADSSDAFFHWLEQQLPPLASVEQSARETWASEGRGHPSPGAAG